MCMRFLPCLSALAIVTSLACPLAATAAEPSGSDVTKSLETIQRVADAIASGHTTSSSQLRDSARTIGLEWAKVEPALAQEYLVETRFANQSIAAFEHDWTSPKLVRSDAKAVTTKVADLLQVERQAQPSPEPSGAASPGPSASPSGSR